MTPLPLRHLPIASARRVRWRNGLGWTREIARVPDSEDWNWRLSIAEIDQTAPFSRFPGVDRVLVLLSGGGLRLDFEDGPARTLRAPFEFHRFDGEAGVTGVLLDGPTCDFNLMWRREAVDARLEVVELEGAHTQELAAGEEGAIHLLRGSATLGDLPLAAQDTVAIGAQSAAHRVRLEGSGTALQIRIRPRP